MTSLIQDLRHAFRSLRASPGFALAAVLSLALGVGANTSLFTALYAVALRPLPVRDARRVVVLHQETRIERRREIRGSPLLFAYPEYRDYRDRARTLAGLAAYADARFTLGGAAPLPVDGLLVSCDYFAVLGEIGRAHV